MLPALARALEKVNIFLLSFIVATILGAQSFAQFSIMFAYALICFSLIELGGQQLYTFLNKNELTITPFSFNLLKSCVFVFVFIGALLTDYPLLTGILTLSYYFESLSNSYRFALFHEKMHQVEAKNYLAERLITFVFIGILYFDSIFFGKIEFSLLFIYVYLCVIKLIFLLINKKALSKNYPFSKEKISKEFCIYFMKHGKYFIISAFVAALFMQVDIFLFNWLNAPNDEIALISAMLRLITATYFIATVFQQFILPRFNLIIQDTVLFELYERYMKYFAFFITLTLILLSELFITLFFGNLSMSSLLSDSKAIVILILVYSRFCREPVSLYLGQKGQNKLKIKIFSLILPLKILAVAIAYKMFGFSLAILVLVIADITVYLSFRALTMFKLIEFSYILGLFILTCSSYLVVHLALPVQLALALVTIILSFYYFTKVTKPGVLFK
ncbi:hypothetical protein [Colwellia sp. RSH04]|uniref:hypothetical protein n=1 Tax=Colwellia sp. RSH04 TaxID=2305464 RepID=UPI000E57C0F1|nr:hypothetical protein [Colwellia sp. RSH04]RHW74906.1 hypothetical protein D1094_16660 [Colwellia sp. RSH04]